MQNCIPRGKKKSRTFHYTPFRQLFAFISHEKECDLNVELGDNTLFYDN